MGQSDGKLVEGITSRGDGVDVPAEGGQPFHHHHGNGPANQEVEGKKERRLGEPDLLLGEAEGSWIALVPSGGKEGGEDGREAEDHEEGIVDSEASVPGGKIGKSQKEVHPGEHEVEERGEDGEEKGPEDRSFRKKGSKARGFQARKKALLVEADEEADEEEG